MWGGCVGSYCFMASDTRGEMGVREISDFLSHLATERGVSGATQNQAKAALLFENFLWLASLGFATTKEEFYLG